MCKVVLSVRKVLDLDRQTESPSLLVDNMRHISWHVATNARADIANTCCCWPLAFCTFIYSINVFCQIYAEVALVWHSKNDLRHTILGLITTRRTDKSKDITLNVDFTRKLCAFINLDSLLTVETNTDSVLGDLTDTPKHAALPRDNFPGRIKCDLASCELYRYNMDCTEQIFCWWVDACGVNAHVMAWSSLVMQWCIQFEVLPCFSACVWVTY